MPEILKWRVMLKAEDGTYCLEDGMTEFDAELYLSSVEKNYGEGQTVFIESYETDIYA